MKTFPIFHDPCTVFGLWIQMLWTLWHWRLHTGGNLYTVFVSFILCCPTYSYLYVFSLCLLSTIHYYLFASSTVLTCFLPFTTHTSEVPSIIMKLYKHFCINIMHTMPYVYSWRSLWHEGCGNAFLYKNKVLFLGKFCFVGTKLFCESTLCQLETIRSYRGTVIQRNQFWCLPLSLVALVHLRKSINGAWCRCYCCVQLT
jgi:hypothetical protein